MNITFLIGNGFDINLGLKTRYTDFLKEYRVEKPEDSEVIQWFKKQVLSDEKLWADAEIALGQCTKAFKFFSYNGEDLCECHEDFCNQLAEYLEKEEQKLEELDLGPVLAVDFKEAISNCFGGFRENQRGQINDALMKANGGYCYNFVSFNYTRTLDAFVEAFMKAKSLLGTRRYGNTTYENSVGKLLHVHGYTDRDMIFGVNDESQISDAGIFDGYGDEYMGQIIKQSSNEMYGQNMDSKVYGLLQKSDIIYIYGMSIGLTDKLWWRRICTIMKENPQMQLIIHAYDAPQGERLYRKFITYSKELRANFTGFGELSAEERDEIATRIHVDRTNIFKPLEKMVGEEDGVSGAIN
ncbi:MAG: hypothetical protein IJ419_09980 [Agathobacter sp.]|nr:hypothetical protein [Agathobacter sp.]